MEETRKMVTVIKPRSEGATMLVHKSRAVGPSEFPSLPLFKDPEAWRRFEIESSLFSEVTLPTCTRLALTKE